VLELREGDDHTHQGENSAHGQGAS